MMGETEKIGMETQSSTQGLILQWKGGRVEGAGSEILPPPVIIG